ncbi:hypothetical protein [Nonomuraea typhae]|uniref:Uncharacterized protein n=1 Tax=Nonomuraea typhae TaxID=2603600 RepID=A0ABW7Z7E2_9ACTN
MAATTDRFRKQKAFNLHRWPYPVPVLLLTYVGLYMALWQGLSLFLPSGAAIVLAAGILTLGTGFFLWQRTEASLLLGRHFVARAHSARVHAQGTAGRAHPLIFAARLCGVGSPADRFSLALIDREPERLIGGVRAGALAPLKDRNLYAVVDDNGLELWGHERLLTFCHLATFSLRDIRKTEYIDHDPDRLNLLDDHIRCYVGTYEVIFHDRRRLFLYVRIKPRWHFDPE